LKSKIQFSQATLFLCFSTLNFTEDIILFTSYQKKLNLCFFLFEGSFFFKVKVLSVAKVKKESNIKEEKKRKEE
jgi:hypothetical protein